MQPIEKSVSHAILQHKEEVVIAGRKYQVSPPTPATLIMASEYIAELPILNGDDDSIGVNIIRHAKEAQSLGKVVATLIIGAKQINKKEKVRVGLFKRINEFEYISQWLLENLTNTELAQIITDRLNDMEIGTFFGITTSLAGVNVTKATKEVVTASGE